MHRLAVLILPSLLLAAPAQAAERKFDAEAAAKAVAPFLDDRTVAVAHVDLTRIDVDAFAEKIAALTKMKADNLADEKKAVAGLLQALTKAGAKDAFFVVSLADLPGEMPFVVLPLEKGADAKAILDLTPKDGLHSYGPFANFRYEQIGAAVVGGGDAARQRLKDLKPVARPELARAFAASGDGVARVALFATTDTRKVLEEMLPNLPPELGGGPITVLTRGLRWVSLTLDAPPKLRLHGVVQAADKDSAKALHELVLKVRKFLGEQKEVRELPGVDKLLDAFTPKPDGDRLTLDLDDATLTAVLGPVAQMTRESATRTGAANNLHQLGIALHNYHGTYERFPAVASFDKQDRPLLSWRVHILPYVGEGKLYKEFKLDEPWDSDHNKKLITKMPKVFANPYNPKLAEQGKTTYLAPVHKDAVFTGDKQGVRIADILDGTANTILLVDADDAAAVVWTKPDDLKLDSKEPQKGLAVRPGDRYFFELADGAVYFAPRKIDAKTLWAMFTRNGGEVVNLP
jgi:hypothetical protein